MSKAIEKEDLYEMIDALTYMSDEAVSLEKIFPTSQSGRPMVSLFSKENEELLETLKWVADRIDFENPVLWICEEVRKHAANSETLVGVEAYRESLTNYYQLLKVYRILGATLSEVDNAYMLGLGEAYQRRQMEGRA